jgi:hypothetical protein|eukprot:COSAG01_NODE_6415_length_3678_cov_3.374965_3_plen_44_part_00
MQLAQEATTRKLQEAARMGFFDDAEEEEEEEEEDIDAEREEQA